MPHIDDTPRTFAVIGDPIDHSLSPVIHNAAFKAQKLFAVYLRLQVRAADVKNVPTALTMTDIEGCNVTAPHKQTIMRHLDQLDASAKRAGAVNTIYQRRGKWVGANTDGQGFLAACKWRKVKLRGKTVVILGAGGAASGISAALLTAGIGKLIILNRTLARAQKLKRHLQKNSKIDIQTAKLSSASCRKFFAESDIVIHATSARMNTLHLLPPRVVFCECQYASITGRRASVTGLDLLVGQAAESYALWTGKKAPITAMRQAVAKHTRTR